MDLIPAFLRGLVVGFAIAAAIGPIGLLCIRRTLVEGAVVGAVSGLGAATADGIYASVAAFGLTAVADFLVTASLAILRRCEQPRPHSTGALT